MLASVAALAARRGLFGNIHADDGAFPKFIHADKPVGKGRDNF